MITQGTPRSLSSSKSAMEETPRGAIAGLRHRGRAPAHLLARDLRLRFPAARDRRLMAVNESAILKSELRWAVVVARHRRDNPWSNPLRGAVDAYQPAEQPRIHRPQNPSPVGRVHRRKSRDARRPQWPSGRPDDHDAVPVHPELPSSSGRHATSRCASQART